MAESRRREDCDLSLWWSERHCANQFDRIAQPDGLGVWEEAGNGIVFCLEYDRSTETMERLEKKLKGYVDLQMASGLAYWICFCFCHPRREAGARRVLAPGHRSGGGGGTRADTAAARGHLGAGRLRGPPVAARRAAQRAHSTGVAGADRRDPGVPGRAEEQRRSAAG